MNGALQNLTTPFKASVVALVSHKLVAILGMGDADASYVGEALWLLLMSVGAYVLPADLGLSGASTKILGWILRLKAGAPAIVLLAGLALGGCSAQRDRAADCASAQAYLAQAEVIVSGLCASVTTTTLPPP